VPGRKIVRIILDALLLFCMTKLLTIAQDNTDSQYHSFRQNLPYMGLLLAFHPLLRRVWNKAFPVPPSNGGKRPAAEAANARLNQRTSFDFTFALLFLVILHGFSAAKVLLILYLNYNLAKRLPKHVVPAATWIVNISLLFANELCQGYHFKDIATFLTGPEPVNLASGPSYLVSLGSWMDSYGGLMPRWEILFNITILRLISFNLDYYWSLDRRNASSIEVRMTPRPSASKGFWRPEASILTESGIGSPFRHNPKTTVSATMLATRSTRPYT
jgi:protein-cysteine N-palmitoyltransferase HHAT